jgi:hypothetical protein
MEDEEVSAAVSGPIRDQIIAHYKTQNFNRDTDAYCIWRAAFSYAPNLKATLSGPHKFNTREQQDTYYSSLSSQDAIKLRGIFHGSTQYYSPMPIIIHVITGGALANNQFISIDLQE